MNEKTTDDRWGGVVGGVVLVLLGGSLLLAQFDLVARRLWSAWGRSS